MYIWNSSRFSCCCCCWCLTKWRASITRPLRPAAKLNLIPFFISLLYFASMEQQAAHHSDLKYLCSLTSELSARIPIYARIRTYRRAGNNTQNGELFFSLFNDISTSQIIHFVLCCDAPNQIMNNNVLALANGNFLAGNFAL